MTEPAPAPATTRDVVFLAVTRPATIYGVPLGGFLLAAGAGGMAFNLSHSYNVWWRLGGCGGAALALLGVLRVLTSWEHNWLQILAAWWGTGAPATFAEPTRRFGGSTLCPLPVAIHRRVDEMRDYAG